MSPDLRTVSAMLAASALLMSLVLCVGIRTRRADGFLKWNLGLGVLTSGWLLSMLRGWLPDAAAVAGAEALLLTGFCLQLAAVGEFGQRRSSSALWALPGPLLFLVLLLMLRNHSAMTAAASLACAAALAATATAARRLGGGGPPRSMLALACDAGALVLIARAAGAVLLPPWHAAASALEQAVLIALFAASAAASIGFLLLHRERVETGLARLAAYDPLTEVFNRLAFIGIAEGQIARARRSGEPCAILMIDPDHLGSVNERLRRRAGDQVLHDLAALLRGSLRTGDLVGRYEDEEFCVLLPNTTLRVALEIAERLRATVAARRLAGVAPAVTVSIGVASCEAQRAGALHAAIAWARKALLRAKSEGRNRVASPPPEAAERALGRLRSA